MNEKLLPGFPVVVTRNWSNLMDFYTRALEINKKGWRIVNCFQFAEAWRVNLQSFTTSGASTEYFSDYADGETPLDALEAAFANATARHPKAAVKATPPPRQTAAVLTASQEKRLERALGDLFFAIKMDKS